jgi:hypothetical protein
LGSDGVARRLIDSLPATNQALQINFKRRQELTPEALTMQRVCSAALLAVFAIAYAVFSCVKNCLRFDSRRLH